MSECPGCGKPVDKVILPDIWICFLPNHQANEMQEQHWHKLCLAAQLPEVRALVKIARFILQDSMVTQDGYASLGRGCDEDLRAALAPFAAPK